MGFLISSIKEIPCAVCSKTDKDFPDYKAKDDNGEIIVLMRAIHVYEKREQKIYDYLVEELNLNPGVFVCYECEEKLIKKFKCA